MKVLGQQEGGDNYESWLDGIKWREGKKREAGTVGGDLASICLQGKSHRSAAESFPLETN